MVPSLTTWSNDSSQPLNDSRYLQKRFRSESYSAAYSDTFSDSSGKKYPFFKISSLIILTSVSDSSLRGSRQHHLDTTASTIRPPEIFCCWLIRNTRYVVVSCTTCLSFLIYGVLEKKAKKKGSCSCTSVHKYAFFDRICHKLPGLTSESNFEMPDLPLKGLGDLEELEELLKEKPSKTFFFT